MRRVPWTAECRNSNVTFLLSSFYAPPNVVLDQRVRTLTVQVEVNKTVRHDDEESGVRENDSEKW